MSLQHGQIPQFDKLIATIEAGNLCFLLFCSHRAS